ncbi:MAG: ribosome maturation factor RimM [Pseudomonadota bacterium]
MPNADRRPSATQDGVGGTPTRAANEARVCVGAVAGAYGVRGEARLKPFTAKPEDIAAYGPVETEDGARRFTLRITRAIKGGLAARLSGVDTREQAEALKGVRLYVERTALPDLPDEEEYYHADLIGIGVEDLSGEPLGQVVAVWDFGAGDVLEVARARGKTVYLPFTREAVPHLSVAERRAVADPPDGLFGPEAESRDRPGSSEEGEIVK